VRPYLLAPKPNPLPGLHFLKACSAHAWGISERSAWADGRYQPDRELGSFEEPLID